MKTENKILINDLLARMNQATQRANALKEKTLEHLNHKSSAQSWSALQCIEHLNLYGDFYLPEIEKQLAGKPKVNAKTIFKSGVIGNYFANLMLPKKTGSLKKMKAPVDKTPASSDLTLLSIDRFLKQAEKLKQLLQQAEQVDLTKTKTAISLTKMIRLRMGDTLRFVVYHIERHLAQAERA
ncbi:MAG: DinB family protein [Crocinitomicaceae bacterium]|nr:DinB family protein [Crocinitomicaceae bacterium]